jgi:hypothetical protein
MEKKLRKYIKKRVLHAYYLGCTVGAIGTAGFILLLFYLF